MRRLAPTALVALACLIPTSARSKGPDSAPQPVAWPAGPLEVRVAFLGPVDPAIARGAVGRSITFRRGTRDGHLRIAAARLVDGGRTLALATDPHPWPTAYALVLPDFRPRGGAGPAATLHLGYALNGVEATWSAGDQEDAPPAWSAWWPAVDTEAVRKLAAVSAGHARQLADMGRPGRLTLRAQATLPAGKTTLRLEASRAFEATLGDATATSTTANGVQRADLAPEATGEPVELSVTLTTGGGAPPSLTAALVAEADPAGKPLPRDRLLLPWVSAPPAPAAAAATPPFDLAGGDPKRGEAVFFSEEARCSTCHKVHGRGGEVGPDLTDLSGRDRATLYRDIADPGAEIHPDYVPYAVSLKGGRVAAGIVRAEGADSLRVTDTNAQATLIPKADVEELRPSSTSIMPVGLAGALGEAKLRDLIAFLVTRKQDDSPQRTQSSQR